MSEMSPELEPDMELPGTVVFDGENPAPLAESESSPAVEATVWRLGPGGMLISSVVERHAAWLAEQEKETIFFYADLGESGLVKNDEETSQKVFRSLASVGLTEGQIINAVNRMQQDGILFREAAV